jgi:hypothetical protein
MRIGSIKNNRIMPTWCAAAALALIAAIVPEVARAQLYTSGPPNFGQNGTSGLLFQFGFTNASGVSNNGLNGLSFLPPVPTITQVNSTTWLVQYSDTETSATGGATASASLSMDWGEIPGGSVGFTNIDISLSQSNPNDIPVTPAELTLAAIVDVAPDPANVQQNGVAPGFDTVNTSALAIVGPNTGDYASYSVHYDALSDSASDTTLDSEENLPLIETVPATFGFNELELKEFEFDAQAEDFGDLTSINETGATGSASSVPEPAGFSLIALISAALLRRSRVQNVCL